MLQQVENTKPDSSLSQKQFKLGTASTKVLTFQTVDVTHISSYRHSWDPF